MSFSYWPKWVTSDYQKIHPTSGAEIAPDSMLPEIMTKYCWCPSILKNSYRCRSNFVSVDWIGLDIDHGEISLADAIRRLCDMQHIIGTTVSHQRWKPSGKEGVPDSPPCDRYRIILKPSHIITDYNDYHDTVESLKKTWFCDKYAMDAVRYFKPCREIVSIDLSNDLYTEEVIHKEHAPIKPITISEKRLPLKPSSLYAIRNGIPVGERNVRTYSIVFEMLIKGYSREEVIGSISKISLTEKEKIYIVDNTIRRIDFQRMQQVEGSDDGHTNCKHG